MNRTRNRLTAAVVSSLVAVSGVAGAVPTASPAAAQEAPADPAPAEPTAPPATAAERRAAASLVNLRITTELMLLGDSEFVLMLWKAATTPEAKASAELAIAGGPTAAAEFIRTGLAEALVRDEKKQERDETVAREARERRQSAASIVGMPVTPETLLRSDESFTVLLWNFSSGPKVKAAAVAAIEAGTADALVRFLTSGVGEAYLQDFKDAQTADEQATAEKRARDLWREHKRQAAAVVRIDASEGMLAQSDRSFVAEIMNAAPVGTAVRDAALRALGGTDAEVTAFIFPGIHHANDRDIAAQRAREATANRERALIIKTEAERRGVQPRLANAAQAALAGTDDQVADFLREGQYLVLVQSLQPVRSPQTWVRPRGADNQLMVDKGTLTPGPGDGRDASWRVVPGRSNAGCASFESVDRPGHYLTVVPWGDQHHKVVVSPPLSEDWYRRAVTWCASAGPSLARGMQLESQLFTGTFMRHYRGEIFSADGTGTEWNTGEYFPDDITWNISGENPTTTGIDYRLANNGALASLLGAPVGDEVVDGGTRYRDFQNGHIRMHWTAATGAWVMYGSLLDRYKSVGAYKHSALGAPTMDEAELPGGWFTHFANGGSIYCDKATMASWLVYGAIKGVWSDMGWEHSWLGYPASDEGDWAFGRVQRFVGGYIAWDYRSGVTKAYTTAEWSPVLAAAESAMRGIPGPPVVWDPWTPVPG